MGASSPRTLKLTAPHTRVPDAINACSASFGVTFIDVSIAAVAIDSLITAELALDVVAKAAGGRPAFVLFAELFVWKLRSGRMHIQRSVQ